MFDSIYIELDSSALNHNIKQIRKWLGDDVILSSVVKGNAYGHGIDKFIPMLRECGVEHFSVFSASEAYQIKSNNAGNYRVMVMGMIEGEGLAWAIENDVEFFVFDYSRMKAALQLSKQIGKPARIHLELETGMNRTGLVNKELRDVLELIKSNPHNIILEGVCTHLAGAESISNYHRIKRQREKFKRLIKKMSSHKLEPNLVHMACSAASLIYPSTRYDLARIGILQYGFFPSQEVLISYQAKEKYHDYPLKRVLSWKSKVMDINHVKTGEFVGYGTSYLTNKNTKVAIVPVGYASGFKRSLSNQGRVLINGSRLSVIGTVNMNMIAVDVSELDNIEKGDEVVFIGSQGDLEISVASFSDYSHQVNYELLTRLPKDIPRIVK